MTLRRAGNFQVKRWYDETAAQYGVRACKEIATFTIKGASDADNKVRVNVRQGIHGIINLSSAPMVEEVEEIEEEGGRRCQGRDTGGRRKEEEEEDQKDQFGLQCDASA